MNKYPLIGVSIVVVVLLILGSLTNVVGYNTVQSSNQKIINEEINQRELLFQTIVDIANNKEIQKVILGSEMTGKRFFDSGMRFSVFTPPVLTEKFLKRMYTMSVILTKTISKSKMQSMIKHYQVNNQKVQNEISTVIERDAKLKGEITQLSNSKCDCENNNTTHLWNFPILCLLLLPFEYIAWILFWFAGNAQLNQIVMTIAIALNCFWIVPTPP